MRLRPSFWIGLCVLLLAGAWLFWPAGERRVAQPTAGTPAGQPDLKPDFSATHSASTAPLLFAAGKNSTNAVSTTKTNPFPYRLSNTPKTIGELTGDHRAILLENALIDTGAKLNLAIPKNLQAQGDPGAYIVQARGPIDASFRAALAAAGAEIISYIPNNAYLVRVTAGGANRLKTFAQAVIPYEPYYKVQSPLLAYAEKTLPPGAALNLGLFAGKAAETLAQVETLGGTVLGTDTSPFGPVVRVSPPKNWTALAVLPGVQIVEAYHPRTAANDLSRASVGVAVDSTTTTNYLNLDGKNVLVQVNDSGIDATHPDLVNRVLGLAPINLVDTNGHGTFVAGIIAGDGTKSTTVTNAQGSFNRGTNGQYRGKAPMANLLSVSYANSDRSLQELAALTNALISNNSWNYADSTYNLAAASYDAAVRDALTQIPGSQPVLFVFSSGNSGRGNNGGTAGNPDTILSPATAKNVITVGALEQYRNITNIVTDASSNKAAIWQPQTDSSSQVASYSSRGNVGVGTEGANGRYKPDVVAPGSFVVSTRSQQWDEAAYYNTTNYYFDSSSANEIVGTNGTLNNYSISIPPNAVAVIITLISNANSPVPFPASLPVYVRQANIPTTTAYDFVTTHSGVDIPPDGGAGYLSSVQDDGFFFSVGNNTNIPVSYDVVTEIITTNDLGNYFLVLSNLNNSLSGPPPPYYYRYESGTSMAAADVSGVLALMQDFFTNQLRTTPSPVLLKAMLINGARPTGNYNFNQANTVNFEGWGLVNLPNSLPPSVTNLVTNPGGGTNSFFFLDQSVTNALATGDRQTFLVTVDTNTATSLPLRVTLAWTDPAGNPAAAIKLVNNLDLVVTNLDTGEVFFGNDIPASAVFNSPWATNAPQNLDTINNIENVFLAPQLGARYSVTVVGREVNVNAVTAQTNDFSGSFAPNVVQDFALVISSGDGTDPGAITVDPIHPVVSAPTTSQIVTFVTVTNTPLLNQFVGASSPLMGTNTIAVGTNTLWGTNGNITLGMTNQWHFYVVTNVLGYKYAAFITFLPATLSLPRTGVYADSTDNSTQPEADIDLYVADPHNPNIVNPQTLTNLNPLVISAADKSLTQGGVEFVTYSNSMQNDVYYIGVKSEAQEGSEYGFISIFSQNPFSSTDANGNEYVQGVPLPVNIPDGSTAHPGKAYVFAIATTPIQVERVVVTNTIVHANYGDLIGVLSHNGKSAVLNNHDSLPPGTYTKIYDDSGRGGILNSQPTDGPGSLTSFRAQQGIGPWILTEVDDALTQTGAVTGLTLFIEKHKNLTDGVDVFIPPGTWFYTFLDVPPGYTNLSVYATNLPPTVVPPLQLYLNYNAQPDFVNYLDFVLLTNAGPLGPGNVISYGPPLRPGTYYVGIFNPSFSTAEAFLIARLSGLASAIVPATSTTNGVALFDDMVDNSVQFVSSTQQVASVNVGVVVNHPRVSDLTFTLLSPTGQRVLLMENRGGFSTNGAGDQFITTNNFAPVSATGGGLAQTNYLNVGVSSGSLTITYNMFVIPDEMTVYYGTNSATFTTNNALFDSGLVSGSATTNIIFGPGTSTYLTVIMNQFGNPAGANGTRWTYTAGGISTNYNYLMFTDDTNKTTVPIKYAIPPFVFTASGTNYTLSDFDSATNGEYLAPTNIYDAYGGWNLTNQILIGTNLVTLTNNMVSVVTDPSIAASGSNFLALATGWMTRQIPMTPGRSFSLSFSYRGPGISGWWRGEGDATDSSDPENNGNNGWLVGRFNFPAGEVGQAFAMEDAGSQFQFAGTNTYVQIHQPPFPTTVSGGSESNSFINVLSSPLDVGTGPGLTVEGWINPTNVSFQQPLVEWLARTPTNLASTNIVILAGPYLNPNTSHYYYLLGSTNWTVSEIWARQIGGHLVTLNTANEQNWVYDTFANYGGINRNLWIGLTNNPPSLSLTSFAWSSGLTNPTYFNWLTGQPTNCNNNNIYTVMLGATNGQPGLWMLMDNTAHTCTLLTNKNYGVVEVDEIQPNGVQFWISVTNITSGTNGITITNGCLYANLVDTTNGSHLIYSAPGLVQSGIYQHVALTYNTNSGLASLFYNGTNVASTNMGYFLPKTTGDVLLGKDMSRVTNNFFGGRMDEMSIYSRSLSPSEILSIYNVSFLTTNRTVGKFDPSITPALSLAEARVSFGTLTNVLLGANKTWQSQSFSFTVISNSLPLQITGLQPGMLLDSFNVSEEPLGNLYYFPEQRLESLNGGNAYGNWTLQILDNRTGAYITNANQLVSWQLQIVLQNNALPSVSVGFEEPTTISVPPGEIVDLTVAVPSWANAATNVLVSSTLPVDLLFNQTNAPTGSPVDYTLLTGSTAGVGNPVLTTTPSVPPLLPGQTYHLGVRNPGTHSATVVVRVDFDITPLTNGLPVSSVLNTNDTERYFVFNVTSNAYAATFQLLKLSSNVDLVVRKGAPLPTLLSSDYGSFNVTNADENIYVLTNSTPVPLSAGLWYLGVIKRDPGLVRYTVLAKELDVTPGPTIIPLANGVPFNFTAGPGAALTNFFRFTYTNTPGSIRFQLYNLSGNGDLTVQTNDVPLAPPFFQTSQQPGATPEFISIITNGALTNLAYTWYLGVPNHETNLITYTILALMDTNGVFPAFPGAEGAGAGAVGGGGLPGRNGGLSNTVYHVVTLNDSGFGSLRDGVSSTNRTIVFDVSGTINLASRLVITNSYLTIAGQTAPGTAGITVAGYETSVTNAHDVIIRYVRFRPNTNGFDALRFITVSNVIADHVSAEWSPLQDTSAIDSANVTVQWSMIADALFNGFPNDGSQLRVGNGALTFHHNLYANNYRGNPHQSDRLSLDFVNNVIYNWGTNAGFTFDDAPGNPGGFTNDMNYTANYLIAGADSFAPNIAFWGGTTNTWIFQTNNFIDGNTNHILDGANSSWAMFTNQFTQIGQPFPLPAVATDEAYKAYERVLDFAGAGLFLRDSVDADIVTGVRDQTGRIISTPPASDMVAWWKAENNANDSAGSNNGALISGAGYAAGKVGQAFNFDNSTSQSMQAPYSASLNITSQITIEFWMKGDPANPMNAYQGLVTSDNYLISIDVGNPPTGVGVDFSINDGGTFYDTANINGGGAAVTPGVWHHIAGTYDGTKLQLYVDGLPYGSPMPHVGGISPMPTNGLVSIGSEDGRVSCGCTGRNFWGLIDEATIYKRALSASEIAAIYAAGSAGKSTVSVSALPYLDTDRDGIPDFWETTFGQFPTNASNFLPSTNAPGYTDLEEYLNWLGAPHALTITNTPVAVDLYKLSGNTGNLSFFLTNAVNGTVYLTNNNQAIFTPTANFSGYASFDYYVTNNTTVAYFGPVTVSVVVSAVPILYGSINTNVPPVFTNGVPPNQVIYELNLLTVTNTATLVNTNLTLTYALTMAVDTNAMILNGWPLTYANITNTTPVINTNTGVITWIPSEAQGPGVYIITTVASDSSLPPLVSSNSFSVTVNELNLAPFWPPNIPSQTNYNIAALTTLTVTNTATDADLPLNPLTYQLIGGPAGAVISTNGIITWTPTAVQIGLFTFTTIVTDTNAYALFNQTLSATNVFTVFVSAVAAPFVFTEPAQSITGTSAQLNGMVTPNGLPTTAWFEWGTNTAYGNPTAPVSVGNGFNVVYTTNKLGGLTLNVPYHFRVVAANAAGTNYGFDQILDEANVVAWGADYVNQLKVPVGLSNVVAIAGAYDHSLALKNNGTAVAWGDNLFGQSAVPAGLNSNLVAVAGGEYSSMVLRSNGTVAAWGAGILNQTNVPAGLSNVVLIAGGTYSSLALRNNGSIAAWGATFFGLTTVPPGANNSVSVASGGFHSLAIKNDGTVIVWGDNSAGQTNQPAGLTNVVAVAAGNLHSLALRSDGTVVAWGDNGAGQTNVPPGLTNVIAVAAGGFHSMALKSNGRIVTWGDNSSGQSSVPFNLTNAVAISCGYFHSLALTPQSLASLTNPIVLNLTNGLPQTNTILAGGTIYYRVNVPTNADFATNLLLFALNSPLNVWFTTNTPPTIGSVNDSLLFGAATNGISILSTISAPTNIVPGSIYYLGVNNTNSVPVTYGIEVDFHLYTPTNPTPPSISSIIYTSIGGTNGFLLTWFAPSNYLFQVQWTTLLSPASWTTFTNPPFVSYNTNFPASATNAQFNFFDNGTQTGGFGPTRFYRLILFTAPPPPTNTAPVLPAQSARVINPLDPLTVTNTATDADVPTNTLTYALLNPPVGAVINTNTGVITWTPTLAQAGTSNNITTIVTDNGTPNLTATNSFAVIVNPIPSISSVTFTTIGTTNGFLVKWYAPTNDRFIVQWTTNLSPAVWQNFSPVVTYTGPATPTNGLFTFFDDGTQTGGLGPIRFYRLLLLGATSSNTPPVLPAQSARTVTPLATLTITNAATDADIPAQTLTYTLTNSLTGTNLPTINATNGVITWTPVLAQAGVSNTVTTIVTDNGVPPMSATNKFSILVNAIPSISGITVVTNGLKLSWFAPTNEQFNVQWATNLTPPVVWTFLGGPITSTNGTFTFTDTNALLLTKFYELILLP